MTTSTTFNLSLLDRIVLTSKAETSIKGNKSPMWSLEEDQYLRENLGWMTDAEIGEQLGRTQIAVHLRWSRDLRLPSPSKAPDVVTAHQAAAMLGIDGHKIAHWVDVGLIPGRVMAGGRRIRLIKRITFMVWACAPRNWVYFDITKVNDPHLKRLLKLEQKRWGDEWWTTPQVARYHGVNVGDVKRYIKLGYLHSFRSPVSYGGRHHNGAWSLHFILKSEATRKGFKFVRQGDFQEHQSKLTPRGLKWIRKALRMGWTYDAIGRSMKVCGQTVSNWVYRYVRAK
jgi:hypothetical protein